MNKPIKPKKPSKNDCPPKEFISVDKWVVECKNELVLLDEIENKELFDDGYPNWKKLEELNYEMVHSESYSYSFIQKIFNILNQDFEFGNSLDRDGYVLGLVVTVKIKDPDYQKKLDKFNRRFDIYESQLNKYNNELKTYENWKKEEKIRKLQEELAKINL